MSQSNQLTSDEIITQAAQLYTVVRSTLNVLKVSFGENMDTYLFENDVCNSLDGVLNFMQQQNQMFAQHLKG